MFTKTFDNRIETPTNLWTDQTIAASLSGLAGYRPEEQLD